MGTGHRSRVTWLEHAEHPDLHPPCAVEPHRLASQAARAPSNWPAVCATCPPPRPRSPRTSGCVGQAARWSAARWSWPT